MEPDTAADLVTSSKLNEINTEIDVIVSDKVSFSICIVRKAVQHEVVKHSDKNHIAKEIYFIKLIKQMFLRTNRIPNQLTIYTDALHMQWHKIKKILLACLL
jgi:hypothetical protein